MSMENAIQFYSKVSSDKDLRARFVDLHCEKFDEKTFDEKILPKAKELGYDFTYQEAVRVLSEGKKELDDAMLENVSGGFEWSNFSKEINCSVCEGNQYSSPTTSNEENIDPEEN